jgi:hypothetical protein
MRSRTGLGLTWLLLLAPLTACDQADGTAPTGPEPSLAATPTLSAENGATIVRMPQAEFVVHLDAARGLLAVHAPSNVCGAGSLNEGELLKVTTPSQIEQMNAQYRYDEGQVAIYRASSFADAGLTGGFDLTGLGGIVNFGQFCSFLVGPDRIAEGTVRRVSNFSNANFSVVWQGTLELVGGGWTKLAETYELTGAADDPNNPDFWSLNNSKILLSPSS